MSKNFMAQKAKGKTVEQIVKRHMQHRGHIVQDMSEIPEFQEKDIDFILIDKDTESYTTLEVKRDDNISKTANFFFEMESEDEYGRISAGWTSYCEAEYICFYDTNINKGYVIALTAIKPLLSTIGRVDFFYDKYDQKMRKSVLVPIGTMRKHGFIVYEFGGNNDEY